MGFIVTLICSFSYIYLVADNVEIGGHGHTSIYVEVFCNWIIFLLSHKCFKYANMSL